MEHTRLIIHRLDADDAEVAVSLATLMVVRRAGSPELDWEVVAQTPEGHDARLGGNTLSMLVITGAGHDGAPRLSEVSGDAVVVRHVDSTVVWRGDGPLSGFEDSWLS